MRSATATRSGSTPAMPSNSVSKRKALVRITTRIGHFVISAWRTEGIRPGVVAASHHMGRWRIEEDEARSWGAGKATIDHAGTQWKLTRQHGMRNWDSARTATPTRSGSGGTTPVYTRTSRSRSSPIRSLVCSVGISGCGSHRRGRRPVRRCRRRHGQVT